jgi:hypothetical protein
LPVRGEPLAQRALASPAQADEGNAPAPRAFFFAEISHQTKNELFYAVRWNLLEQTREEPSLRTVRRFWLQKIDELRVQRGGHAA